mgnify:CR=1 FL=1
MSRNAAEILLPQNVMARAVPALDIDGERIPVDLQINPRARRLIVRVPHRGGGVVVVAPSCRAAGEALAFAEKQKVWIAQQLEEKRGQVRFEAGAPIPILGDLHKVLHMPGARAGVWIETSLSPLICVSGQHAHLERRLCDYLKRRARTELMQLTSSHCEALSVALPRVTLRDPATRWGSCSHASGISYSWRLIFAPHWVMDYVVAHEVAHLVHMNHSKAFWRLVASRTSEARAAIRWLAREGRQLHKYGP